MFSIVSQLKDEFQSLLGSKNVFRGKRARLTYRFWQQPQQPEQAQSGTSSKKEKRKDALFDSL